MENLKRIREPLAWALITLSGLSLLMLILQFSMYLLDSEVIFGWVLGLQTVDYGLTFALVAVAWVCALAPAVPRARTIALVAAWVVALTTALPWAFAVLSLLTPAGWPAWISEWSSWQLMGLLYPLVNTGVGVVAAIALWALARSPEPAEDDVDEETEPADQGAAVDEPAGDPTVWRSDQATGSVWRTADEAATGAPGTTSLGVIGTGGQAASPPAEPGLPGASADDAWRPPASS